MSSTATVFLVDDDPSIRKAVSRLLQSKYTVQSFSSAEEFLREDFTRGPSCLLLDLRMPGLNGLQLQQQLKETGRYVPVVFISGHGDIPSSVQAMKAGAMDFLPKPFDVDELVLAVNTAMTKGEEMREWEDGKRKTQNHLKELTEREGQVLSQVIQGRLNKQIAKRLKISEKTVKVHRARVMKKMHARSLAELVQLTTKLPHPHVN